MAERLEYLESKLNTHKQLGSISNLSILEVAKLMDNLKITKQNMNVVPSMFFSYGKAS
jgi:hypothetical protein